MIKITSIQVDNLKIYVDKKLNSTPCDHSLRFTKGWADLNTIDLNDLIDILEENGGFCDCEVVMNLPENEDIILTEASKAIDKINPWRLPDSYQPQDISKQYSKILTSTNKCKGNCYAEHNEMLIPAPYGAKPKKRIRKSVHFFVGQKSGMPNEYGFVTETKSITAREFAKQIRDYNNPDLTRFTENEADYYLSRLENLKVDTPVGIHFMERNGMFGKGEDIKIHKIFGLK